MVANVHVHLPCRHHRWELLQSSFPSSHFTFQPQSPHYSSVLAAHEEQHRTFYFFIFLFYFFKSMPPAPLSRRQQSEQLLSGTAGVLDYLSKSWRVQESRSCCRGRSQGDTLIPSKSTRFGIKVIPDSAASGHCSSWSLMLLI